MLDKATLAKAKAEKAAFMEKLWESIVTGKCDPVMLGAMKLLAKVRRWDVAPRRRKRRAPPARIKPPIPSRFAIEDFAIKPAEQKTGD